ncbi:MAG TPA: EF-hand domain-containing protein [Caulobacteraceae bacterium]|jgi:hypothetical protein
MARPPKKSESLEIRLPYATKTAFMARCRVEGASASETLRTFIEDKLASGRTVSPARRRLGLRAAAAAAAALAVGATALPSLARPLERAGFEQFDRDGDGTIAAAEFARLDRDGDGSVSFAEFRRR